MTTAQQLFAGPGEIRALGRTLDWSATPLGPVEGWPVSLRITVGTLLAAPTSIIVLWGPALVQLYNDGYREIMRDKHPAGFGQRNRECWPEVWDSTAPLYEGVLERGESFTFADRPLVLLRDGVPQEGFFTQMCSPIPDDDGAIGGILVMVTETTAQVRAQTAREVERDRLLADSEAARTQVTATLESIGDGFYAIDAAFRFIYVNRRAEELLRRSRESLIGRNLWAEFPAALHTAAGQRYHQAMRDRQAAHFETPSAVDGRWVDVSIYPDAVSGGLACYFRDVTERMRAEAALRTSEAKYRALFDSLDAGFCIIEVLFDGDGRPNDYRFLEANPAFTRQTGLTDAIGRRIRELAPAHEGHWFDSYGRVARTGESSRFEAPAAALGRYYEVYAFRIGEPGEHRVAVLFTDISDTRATEQMQRRLLAELQVAERRSAFLATLGAALQPLTDPDAVMATAARLLGEHLGVDRCAYAEVERDEDRFTVTGDYVRGDTISMVGRFAFRAFGAEVLRQMRADEPYVMDDAETDPRVTAERPTYERTQIRSVICVPLHKAGRVAAAMAVHQRVSRQWIPDEIDLVVTVVRRCWESLERARAHRSLREREAALQVTTMQLAERTVVAEAAQRSAEAASRAKSEFLAVMSHELRTPLNAIGGYAELLEMGLRGPVTDPQRADLARIQQSQRHLLGLINQILNYTRVHAGAVQYDVTDVPVSEALAAAEALIVPQTRARGLAYDFGDGCADALTVRVDREKLQQILLNLLTNAIKFTEPGGAVRVSCAERADHVALSVADTGIGIASDKLASIFDPFVQVDQRLTRPHEGVGLGLAISRDLARGMGGDLTATSAVGVGSVFTLTVPRIRPGTAGDPQMTQLKSDVPESASSASSADDML